MQRGRWHCSHSAGLICEGKRMRCMSKAMECDELFNKNIESPRFNKIHHVKNKASGERHSESAELATTLDCSRRAGLFSGLARHSTSSLPPPLTPASPQPQISTHLAPQHLTLPRKQQSALVDHMTTVDIQNLKSFDPFAEADDAGGEAKVGNQQNYIHIRIQRKSAPWLDMDSRGTCALRPTVP